MPSVTVETLSFDFPAKWTIEKYDDWHFYQQSFQSTCQGAKAVDIVAVQSSECCWLIEVTDYRRGVFPTLHQLANEIAMKVRDTLAGLAAARAHATGDEKRHAHNALSATSLRVVCHFEQPGPAPPLQNPALDWADVKQQLRQRIRAIDGKAEVVNTSRAGHLPWTVR